VAHDPKALPAARRLFLLAGAKRGSYRARVLLSVFGARLGGTLHVTLPAPTITGINPTSGLFYGGTTVTISGKNFQPDAAVYFGSTPATVSSISSTTIVVTTPIHVSGAVPVTVINPDGGTSIYSSYTYLGLFVAAGNGKIATSTDGLTWNAQAITGNLFGVIYVHSLRLYVAVGAGVAYYSTDDCATWQAGTNVPATSQVGIAYGNGVFATVPSVSSTVGSVSADGKAWNATTVPNHAYFTIGFGPNAGNPGAGFSAGDTSGGATSADGSAWTDQSFTAGSYQYIRYNSRLSKWIGLCSDRAMSSANGIAWTQRKVFTGVSYNSGFADTPWGLVARAQGASNNLAISLDGLTWNESTATQLASVRRERRPGRPLARLDHMDRRQPSRRGQLRRPLLRGRGLTLTDQPYRP